jgi:HD superfamily phosphodiesterase
MDPLVQKFKEHVIEKAGDPSFLHQEWYVKYHLNIVEKISLELCEKYLDADKDLVLLVVWLHDYGKILEHGSDHSFTLEKGREKLSEMGFESDVIKKAILCVDEIDKKDGLLEAPIEAKIVSSADAASHLVGPFFSIYWYEYHNKSINELIEDGKAKLAKDWNKKVVLPEVKEKFESRYRQMLEQYGDFPETFLG